MGRLAQTLGRIKTSMSTIPAPIQLFLIIFGWATLCYALPRELMRKSAAQHYREWIGERAYWGRNYYKWIIGDLVFYTDELWADIIFCLLAGPGINWAYISLLEATGFDYLFYLLENEALQLRPGLTISITTSLLLFATRVYDRCYLASEEIVRQQLIDPDFSGQFELQRILDGDRQYIRRVIGKHAINKTVSKE